LTTAVAAGVVSTFGTPYGGIMFSIELCSSVYLISNLYKSFVCGAIGTFLYTLFHNLGLFSSFRKAQVFVEFGYENYHFVVLFRIT